MFYSDKLSEDDISKIENIQEDKMQKLIIQQYDQSDEWLKEKIISQEKMGYTYIGYSILNDVKFHVFLLI